MRPATCLGQWSDCLRSRTTIANAWFGWSATFSISRRWRRDRSCFNFSRVEVRSLVAQAIEANRGFAEGYGVRIRFDEACTAADVRADPDRLLQVVTNLLSNAIKFSPADNEVVVAVEKGTRHGTPYGTRPWSGHPSRLQAAHLREIRPSRCAANARQKGGTGLGLSIVKQIVDRLSGEVGFADAPGGGTIFYVQLPCWDHVASLALDRDAKPGAAALIAL